MVILTVENQVLLQALQSVVNITDKRSNSEILSHVLVEVKEEQVCFTGTDLEVELKVQIEATSGQTAAVTIPARKLLDICRTLPGQAIVQLTSTNSKVQIEYLKSKFLLNSLVAESFPSLSLSPGDCSYFYITNKQLRKLIESVQFAVAQQDVRYYLNGIFIQSKNGNIRTVATDGHRLALCEFAVAALEELEFSAIIPRKGVQELIRYIAGEEQRVEVAVSKNLMRFAFTNGQLSTKLIDGQYPAYEAVIPSRYQSVATIDRALFHEILLRASVITTDRHRGVSLKFSKAAVEIMAKNAEHEQVTDEIEIMYEGEDMEITFNVHYLIDIVSAIESEQVILELQEEETSCIKGSNEPGQLYVVMPMRL